MAQLTPKGVSALKALKDLRRRLTPQQYRTLKGQILAGDSDGALKGLRKILSKERECV